MYKYTKMSFCTVPVGSDTVIGLAWVPTKWDSFLKAIAMWL